MSCRISVGAGEHHRTRARRLTLSLAVELRFRRETA
jgi:hypothetical protein